MAEFEGLPKGIVVRPSEAHAALMTLLASDADLLAEADKLFFGDKPRYKASGILNYFFCLPSSATDWTDGEALAFRPRNKNERFIVLLAPEDHGLTPVLDASDAQSVEPRGLLDFGVTREDPILIRYSPEGGCVLLVHFEPAPSHRTLTALAECKNRTALIERALAVEASEAPRDAGADETTP